MSNVTTVARKRGRPTVYSEAVAAEILTRMAADESLWRICQDRHLPALSTVNLWIVTDREGFSDKWKLAREAQQLARVDEGFRLTEQAMAAGAGWSKERVMALREHLNHVHGTAGRLHPKQFGDWLQLEDERGVHIGVQVVLQAEESLPEEPPILAHEAPSRRALPATDTDRLGDPRDDDASGDGWPGR